MRRTLLLAAIALTIGRPLPAQEPAVLHGRVLDAATRTPIAGAEVLPPGAVHGVLTDSAGAWRLPVPAGVARLRVRRLGYAPRDVSVEAGTPLVVSLEPLPIALDAVVITAARREQKLKDAVPETELISRRDIEQSGSADVGGALTQATGIQLEGGVPAGAGIFLQGLGSQRVLVLLDGQPLVGRINGNFDLSRLPASLVERVEVVRGPQSTLYGSDAMGGVVDIITRPPTDQVTGAVTAIGGTQGRREMSGTLRGSSGRLGFVLDGGARSEDLAPGLPGDGGTYARRWNAAPKLRWQPTAAWTLEGSGLVVGERQRYRTGQLYHFSDNTQTAARLSAVWERGGKRLAPTISYTRFDHLSRASTGSQPVSDSGQTDIQDLAQAELLYSAPVPGGIADVGAVVRREAIRADRVTGTSRALNGLETYAQTTWNAGAFSLSPGLRFSTHQQWGSALTPRLAALVRPTPSLALRGSVGAGYRAPDFKELYLNFVNAAAGYAVVGNPDLRPERSTNVSASAEWVGARFYGRASAYDNRFRGFIDYGAPDLTGTYTYHNVAHGTTRGAEIEAGWAQGPARVEVGYAFLDARDDSTGTPLLGRARNTARLSLSAAVGGAPVSATLQYSGRTPIQRDDVTGAITAWRRPFTRVDLRASTPQRWAMGAVFGVENLFDQRLEQSWPGFTGRRVYAGLTWRVGG